MIYTIDTVAKERPKRLRPTAVYLFIPSVVLEGESYPALPEEGTQIYVAARGKDFAYYTQAELNQMAAANNLEIRTVGYAMIDRGQIVLYINNPDNEEIIKSFREFEAWLTAAQTRLAALLNPPPPPEVPAAPVVYSFNSVRPYLIAVTIVILLSNVLQVVVAIAK